MGLARNLLNRWRASVRSMYLSYQSYLSYLSYLR